MTEQKKQGLECLEPPPQTFLMSTDYETLYAKVKSLWDEYVYLAEEYKRISLYAGGELALRYKTKSDAFYQAIIMLRAMLDE